MVPQPGEGEGDMCTRKRKTRQEVYEMWLVEVVFFFIIIHFSLFCGLVHPQESLKRYFSK